MELLFLLYCRGVLDFSIPDFQYYNCLGVSVLDATFSAQARYASVIHVMNDFCGHYGLTFEQADSLPERNAQITISQLLAVLKEVTPEELADVVHNHSKVGGRLKAALFLDCLRTLHEFEIETYQDFQAQFNNVELETALRSLRGMGEATINYLYMLAGNSNHVKVDRHIRAFTSTAINNNSLSAEQIEELFRYAANELSSDYPGMTARHLDHIVWVYQRNQ